MRLDERRPVNFCLIGMLSRDRIQCYCYSNGWIDVLSVLALLRHAKCTQNLHENTSRV